MKVFDAISRNVAVREFQSKELRIQDTLRILEAGRMCQSGKNLQPWHFVLIRRRETLNKLAELMKGDLDENIVRKAPVAIAIVTDPASETDILDAGRAAQNMTLAAWELGIGSCFMSGPEGNARVSYRKKAAGLLGIPERFEFQHLMVFGYLRIEHKARRRRRKPLREIASENRFGQPIIATSRK